MSGFISVYTFWTLWLFVHLILALGLLGALTHQAMAVALPVRKPAAGIVARFRAVPAAGYATTVCVLYVLTFILGSFIYTQYRTAIRIPLENAHFYKTVGFFDFKEHVATLGLVLLPVMAQGRTIDVDRLVDDQRITGFNWMVVFWCFIIRRRHTSKSR
jgi:hypothetical protein